MADQRRTAGRTSCTAAGRSMSPRCRVGSHDDLDKAAPSATTWWIRRLGARQRARPQRPDRSRRRDARAATATARAATTCRPLRSVHRGGEKFPRPPFPTYQGDRMSQSNEMIVHNAVNASATATSRPTRRQQSLPRTSWTWHTRCCHGSPAARRRAALSRTC
jgi:hypothetical protein